MLPLLSVISSSISFILQINGTFPRFSIVIVYVTSSPTPKIPSSFLVITCCFLIESSGLVPINTTVGSSPVSPAPVSPSSEISIIGIETGFTPVAVTVLLTSPDCSSAFVIV